MARKEKDSKQYLVVVFVVLATLAAIVIWLKPGLVPDPACPDTNINPSAFDVQLDKDNKKHFNLEFAKTPSQLELGLSDRPCFPDNAGLLFYFPRDDRFGIWMKNMHFPIDVVWLDKDKKIVTIEKNMQPSSYPKVFYPTDDARYVIEFATGNVDTLGMHDGTQLNW